MKVLENDFLKISINEKGAELKSFFSKKLNKEFLYDGKSEFWNRSSPVLFPFVGRLKNNSYAYKGKTYSMGQHGFARDEVFEVISESTNEFVFLLKSSEKTKENYPFDFSLMIGYKLNAQQVEIKYKVINKGSETLYFSLGTHPGFVCPFFENEHFEDYSIEFADNEVDERHLLNLENGCFNHETENIPFKDKNLALNYSYFEKDAIVMKNIQSNTFTLKSKNHATAIKLTANKFPYLGVWTKPNAPFICIEPWCGLADNENHDATLETKEGILNLEQNYSFERNLIVELIS